MNPSLRWRQEDPASVKQATNGASSEPPERQRSTRRLSLGQRNKVVSYVLLAPAIVSMLALVGYPLYMILSLSLRSGSTMVMSEISELPFSTEQYRDVLTNSDTWDSLRISLIYTFSTVIAAFGVGLATALVLNRRIKGRRTLRTLALVPWPIPGAIATVAFVWMLDGTYGILNYLLRSVGVIEENIAWFFNPETALIGVLLPTIWTAYPLFTLIVLAALQTVPRDLYEAATVDGASPIREFWHVTWPAIRGASVLAMLLTGLWTFRTFDFVYAITQGGPNRATETLAVAIYNEAFTFFNLSYAAALGVVSMAIALLFAAACFPIIKKQFF